MIPIIKLQKINRAIAITYPPKFGKLLPMLSSTSSSTFSTPISATANKPLGFLSGSAFLTRIKITKQKIIKIEIKMRDIITSPGKSNTKKFLNISSIDYFLISSFFVSSGFLTGSSLSR